MAQVHGVDRRARVRWVMGSSLLFSVLFLVSVVCIISTLGDYLVGVCMICTLGSCVGGDGKVVVGFVIGILTNYIVGFFVLSRLVHWAVQWELCYVGGIWAHFWSNDQNSYGGHLLHKVVHHTFELVRLQAHM